MRIETTVFLALLAGAFGGCGMMNSTSPFDEDLAFLKEHTDVIVLGDNPTGPRVAVVPEYQGRVMTSTTGGADALSHGWVNYELIASGKLQRHINPFGGEDRFWMGPEGGQYAIFFKPGDPFDFEVWQTPAFIDTVGYEVVEKSARAVSFRHQAQFSNYSGTAFDVQIDRTIRLLDGRQSARLLGLQRMPDVASVAYESENQVTNRSDRPWTKEGGLLSIWILGMFRHSPETTVIVPFRDGPENELGPVVNDTYFGKVPADRLKVGDGVLYFKGDGQYRSKIGVAPQRAKDVLGSYDPSRKLLTIAQYTLPAGATDYVNSMWELQDEPYGGDVVNSYNDGPAVPGGKPLGPFYELETSSPAAALAPGQSLTHHHRTFHFVGAEEDLDMIAQQVLGVSLAEVKTQL